MAYLYTHNGKLLKVGAKLASAPACCCNLGACCTYDYIEDVVVCSRKTRAACEAESGLWQGPNTECAGENSDECPCNPPAHHTYCEKCVDSVVTPYCPENTYCEDGTCIEYTGACCTYDEGTESWVCTVTTSSECSGNYQGNSTDCSGAYGTCDSTCCVTKESTLPSHIGGTCYYYICEAGWMVWNCGWWLAGRRDGWSNPGCTETEESDPQPDPAVSICQKDTALPTTVTVSGVVANTGDAGLDAFIHSKINTSYSAPAPDTCRGWGASTTYYDSFVEEYDGRDYIIEWAVGLTIAYIRITRVSTDCFFCGPAFGCVPDPGVARVQRFESLSPTPGCSGEFYDCDHRIDGPDNTSSADQGASTFCFSTTYVWLYGSYHHGVGIDVSGATITVS